MKFYQDHVFFIGLLVTGVFLPLHANATTPGANVPEPLSLSLLAVGAAGLGAAALIRRRKDK
jgi:hypothetical protein